MSSLDEEERATKVEGATPDTSPSVALYARLWDEYSVWCKAHRLPTSMPLDVVIVARWLRERRKGGRAPASLRVDLAALVARHRSGGHEWQQNPPEIRKLLKPLQKNDTASVQRDVFRAAAQKCGNDLVGTRDKLLLLIHGQPGITGAMLVRLVLEDTTLTTQGLVIRAKSQRSGRVDDVLVPRSRKDPFCPVLAFEDWQSRSQLRFGAIFRAIDAAGRLGDALSLSGLRSILKNHLETPKSSPPVPRPAAPRPPPRPKNAQIERSGPDWIKTIVTVSGTVEKIQDFTKSAAGSGVVPWHVDFDYERARLLAPMAGQGAHAASLARLLDDVTRRFSAIAQDRVARMDKRCPFDLQQLVPVPEMILLQGDDAPQSIQWMKDNWGIVCPLRKVSLEELRDARRTRTAQVIITFWSLDWTPWQALRTIGKKWPELNFSIRPQYGSADIV